MSIPKGAQFKYDGLYYKRGVHNFVYLWLGGEWCKSSKYWCEISTGEFVLDEPDVVLGTLVDLSTGERLYVVDVIKDCDGTTLYNLGGKHGEVLFRGFPREFNYSQEGVTYYVNVL